MSIARTTAGITFPQSLTLLFIGLKLTGYIAWSWWLVLAPLWGLWGIAFIVAFVAGFKRARK